MRAEGRNPFRPLELPLLSLLANAQALYPQAAAGTKVTGRYYSATGDVYKQWFSSGGHFRADSDNMRFDSLAKVAALTIDVDAYELDTKEARARWGETRDERKAAMRAASEHDVLAWMEEAEFVDHACAEALDVGLPERPNRVVYTGQGIALIYWLADDEGGINDALTPLRMKEAIKRFVTGQEAPLWWWDACAKDVGTRLVPVPGTVHRVTGKSIWLLRGHDEVTPLTPWIEALEAKYPPSVVKKVKAAKVEKAIKEAKATGTLPPKGIGSWGTTLHDPAKHPVLAVGERADECPLCNGSGYKRLCEEHYSCFSCETKFLLPRAPQPAPKPEGLLDLDANGHAVWPATTPRRLLNMARTGSGKTELMKREKAAYAPPAAWNERVLAVAPTIALAKVLSTRLGIDHADAQSAITLNHGSIACCFASLPTKVGGASINTLNHTYLMIDEAESSLSQLYGMLKGDKSRETLNLLIHVTAHAGKVMLADANAGPVCAKFMADVNEYAKSHNLFAPEWKEWHTAPHRHSFVYIPGKTGKNKKGEEVTLVSSDAMHKGLILRKLGEGKKLAVYIPGREAALAFAAEVKDRFPHLAVKSVVRNLSNDNQNDLSQAALTVDVLVYNNAMATGVSYDVADHYDEVHLLIGQGGVTDGIHIEQAVHRVRKPKCKDFFISGVMHKVINDWRCEADEQLKHAIKRLESGQKAVKSVDAGLTLASDYMASSESRRLARLQATVLAGRFARGFRWTFEWLRTRHDWTQAAGEDGQQFASEVAETRDELDLAEAQAIASASPLASDAVERVEAKGAETEAEYFAFRAAKLEAVYGEGFTNASNAEKAKIAHETKRGRLAQKVRVYAASKMLLYGGEDALAAAKAEVRANREQTVMSATVTLPTARLVAAVLLGLSSTCDLNDTGKMYVSELVARCVNQAATPYMYAAGVKPREDAKKHPFRQLSTLLSFAGIALACERVRVDGKSERRYALTLANFERLNSLAVAFIQRWKDGSDADAAYKSSFEAA